MISRLTIKRGHKHKLYSTRYIINVANFIITMIQTTLKYACINHTN